VRATSGNRLSFDCLLVLTRNNRSLREFDSRERVEPMNIPQDAMLTAILSDALDKALKTVNDLNRQDILADEMARRVLHAAQTGQRDSERLSELALTSLDVDVEKLH
jgi:hypothetical protein